MLTRRLRGPSERLTSNHVEASSGLIFQSDKRACAKCRNSLRSAAESLALILRQLLSNLVPPRNLTSVDSLFPGRVR